METIWKDTTGFDRGFSVHADVLTETVDGVSINSLWAEFSDQLSAWNATRTAIAGLFTFNTTDTNDILREEGVSTDFEKASEFGAPKTLRAPLEGYRVGFPFQWWDGRIGYTRRFLQNATGAQVIAQHQTALAADNALLFREIMTAVATPRLAPRDTNLEGIPLYSLYAAGADDKPPSYLGRSFAANHNHYFVSGAATIDGADLKDLITSVQEHGHGLRDSNQRVVIFVHPNEAEIIRGFRVATGSPYDFIASEAAPAFLTSEVISGEKPPVSFNNLPIFGSYGDALLTESYAIPEKYVLALATSGPGSKNNPLAFRQHPRTESQGLLLIPGTERFPLIGATYERGFGVAVRNRGAAAVMQIKASGSYQVPTFAA